MRNYQDDICTWGYITLCSKCAEIVKQKPNRRTKNIHIDKEVTGVPLMPECEACGGKD